MHKKPSAMLLLAMLLISTPIATLLIPNARANPISIGMLSPNRGPVRTESTPPLLPTQVTIEGVADFAGPDNLVWILWDSPTGQLLDPAAGWSNPVVPDANKNYRTVFYVPNEAVFGEHKVYARDHTSGLSAWRPFNVEPRIKPTPTSGIVDSEVRVDGSGFSGTSTVTIKFDTTTVAVTSTNEWGTFRTTFKVPSSVYGGHTVMATDSKGVISPPALFSVTQSLYIIPESGPVGTKVTLTGYGWKPTPTPVSVTFDTTFVGSKIPNSKGYWTLDWTIPLLPAIPPPTEGGSKYTFTATQGTPAIESKVTFILKPQVVPVPDHGKVNAHIVVTGTGFAATASVDVYFEDGITPIRIWGDENIATKETNASGWFEFAFTVPDVRPGEYTIRAIDEKGFVGKAAFIVGPWVVLNRYHGYVGMRLAVDGYVFASNSNVDIFFGEILVVDDYPTNGKGDFYDALFDVPEVPRGNYRVTVMDPEGTTAYREFFVYPWMRISPIEGTVGTEIEISGTGFPADWNIELWYGGYAEDRENYGYSYYETWDGFYSWEIWTVGDDTLLKTVASNELGSFESSFFAPESWGGYHPIWAGWWVEADEGWDWMQALQEQVFRVVPAISITPTSSVSGQYVHLEGTGFSTWESYYVYTDANHDGEVDWPWGFEEYYHREGTYFVLDFGPVQRYIDEAHYILNNEANYMWYDEDFVPLMSDARGTIIYYDAMYEKVSKIGCPFLQVPFLQPGDYKVTAYRFNEYEEYDGDIIADEYSFDEAALTTFKVEPLKVDLETVLKELAALKGDIKAQADRIVKALDELGMDVIDLIGEVADKLQMEHEDLADLVEEVFDSLDLKLADLKDITTEIKDTEDDILLKIDDIELSLEDIDGTIVGIKNSVAEIKTSIGTVKEDVTKLKTEITAVKDEVITVKTKVGTIDTTLADVNAKITVTKDNVATIQTDVGTIKGRLTSVEGDVATIETDIGTIKTDTTNILKDTEKIPSPESGTATIALSLVAAISAIAAAVMVLRKVYMK